jgi:Na+/H+ antiporter NhaA
LECLDGEFASSLGVNTAHVTRAAFAVSILTLSPTDLKLFLKSNSLTERAWCLVLCALFDTGKTKGLKEQVAVPKSGQRTKHQALL